MNESIKTQIDMIVLISYVIYWKGAMSMKASRNLQKTSLMVIIVEQSPLKHRADYSQKKEHFMDQKQQKQRRLRNRIQYIAHGQLQKGTMLI